MDCSFRSTEGKGKGPPSFRPLARTIENSAVPVVELQTQLCNFKFTISRLFCVRCICGKGFFLQVCSLSAADTVMGRRGRRGRGGVDGGSSPSVWIMSWRWKGEGRRREEKREEGENWGGVRKRNSPLLFFLFPVSRVGLGGRLWLCPHYHSIAATGRRERRKKKSSEEEEKDR